MCGIVGWFSKNGVKKELIALAGLVTQERGDHSSGVYAKETGLVKAPVSFNKFYPQFMEKMPNRSQYGILHDRWATHGGLTNANTHPFEHKEFVLVHNGVVSTGFDVNVSAKEYIKKNAKGETDSEEYFMLFMYYFNLTNKEESITSRVKWAVGKSLSHITGSYTFLIHHKHTELTFLFGNNAKQVYKKDGEIWFFSTKALAESVINLKGRTPIYLNDRNLYVIEPDGSQIWDYGIIVKDAETFDTTEKKKRSKYTISNDDGSKRSYEVINSSTGQKSLITISSRKNMKSLKELPYDA